MIEYLLTGSLAVLSWWPLAAILAGLVIGIVVGAIPGLSPSMGVALLVPFTYGMSPMLALILLLAIYIGASYGGSITAITINAPGTASAVVTAIDGHAMTRQGRPARALGISIVTSAVAGMLGTLVLMLFSQPLAAIAVTFHPAEYFALALFGLATISSLAGANWLKAFIAAIIGLLINTIGTDPISGADRFTFNYTPLSDGFLLIPALIGLFALSEVFSRIEQRDFRKERLNEVQDRWPGFVTYWRLKWVTLRSAFIGTLIGVFPGAGATIASFISYDIAKKQSQTPEQFGQGSDEGVAAAEAANSGSVGGAMVPLLTLGIPGSATTAVLVGAMMIHKLNPGPQLFLSSPELMYSLFAAMLLANLALLLVGLAGSRLWIRVTEVPKPVLFVLISLMAVIGAYSVRNSMFDVFCCLSFGILGWILKRKDYPLAPVILGMVLGSIAETNFRRAVMMDGYDVFLTRPISAVLLGLALLSFVLPLLRNRKRIS
ncbi:tripartite tricarboxylate transporter permease [Alkalimonas sp. MEB108]|uniref:Tripartite tricarboxylate transporter permease n=1 Tax=Alkalimonas cellulosilytica TaxID=3058395 RepID=A0ABU7J434_9GAMM|nr:tripartite tricarboxylate transporter permease [Alkalimonas sp. MEB108]MEE2001142.1 tripartite tricarboxylate transporter permease [Alkalimonas sp. MEB108]